MEVLLQGQKEPRLRHKKWMYPEPLRQSSMGRQKIGIGFRKVTAAPAGLIHLFSKHSFVRCALYIRLCVCLEFAWGGRVTLPWGY